MRSCVRWCCGVEGGRECTARWRVEGGRGWACVSPEKVAAGGGRVVGAHGLVGWRCFIHDRLCGLLCVGGGARPRPTAVCSRGGGGGACPTPPSQNQSVPPASRPSRPADWWRAGGREKGGGGGGGRAYHPGCRMDPSAIAEGWVLPVDSAPGLRHCPPPPAIVHVDADAPWPSHVPTAAALARINLCASAFARLQEGAARGQPEPSRGTSNKRWVGSAWLCQGTRPLRRLPPRRGPHRDRKRGWVTRLGMVAAVGGPPPGTVDRYCTRPRLADWAGTFTRGQAMPARLGWSWGPSAASVVSRGAMTGLRRGAGS